MTQIMPDDLLTWAKDILDQLGVRTDDGSHIAQCLVDVDKRGVNSHGTRLLGRYVAEFRDGLINLAPNIHALRETDQSICD